MIFQGSLHRPDFSWYPDETHDWSRYVARSTMAESCVVQDINTKSIVFGSSAEVPPGAYQIAVTPNPVGDTATVTFTVNDSTYQNTGFLLEIHDANGNNVVTFYQWVGASGVQSVPIYMMGYPAGDYTIVLKANYVTPVDVATFTKS